MPLRFCPCKTFLFHVSSMTHSKSNHLWEVSQRDLLWGSSGRSALYSLSHSLKPQLEILLDGHNHICFLQPLHITQISPLLHHHLSLSDYYHQHSRGKKASLDFFIPLIIALVLYFSFGRIVFATYNALLPFFLDLASVMLFLHINSTEIVLYQSPWWPLWH